MKRFLIPILLSAIALTTFTECSKGPSFIPNKGTVVVLNGMGEKDTIPYTCNFCDSLISDTSLFNEIIRRSTSETRAKLNYPLSFIPRKIELGFAKIDSIILVSSNKVLDSVINAIVKYDYIAKNGYGNELEGDAYSQFYTRGSKILEIQDEIKLENLKFIEGNINRSLSLYDEDKSIEIIPTEEKHLIVITSNTCVDNGSWLVIKLESGEEVQLTSWNDYNCKGTSYFNGFTEEQVQILKNSRIRSIIFHDDESIGFYPPSNKSDYFIQLMDLLY